MLKKLLAPTILVLLVVMVAGMVIDRFHSTYSSHWLKMLIIKKVSFNEYGLFSHADHVCRVKPIVKDYRSVALLDSILVMQYIGKLEGTGLTVELFKKNELSERTFYRLHEKLIEYALIGVYDNKVPHSYERNILLNIKEVAKVMAEFSEKASSHAWSTSSDLWKGISENPTSFRNDVIQLGRLNMSGKCWKVLF
ncbi:MAG: hypothetical protein CL677_05905 [Bdellovibrionaceae bacterium]|nr:hypothetical protein [Pseudobdellovibrionaceae bacterium]|tara:strand:- start:85 stop:669 length:585 start_codon:yes stop_codon:yes gene_type:complete